MELIFLVMVCLLAGSWETEAVSVTGVAGEEIKIRCSHSNAFSNVKYFCKGKCDNENVLISSRKNKIDTNERYSIHDTGNVFFVTISNLKEDDSGTYWCAIERFGWDTYNEVVLTVIEGKRGNTKDKDKESNDDDSQSISQEEIITEVSSSKKLVYIGASLGVALLALAIVLLIFFRHRSRDISTSSGKASCHKQDAHHTSTSPLTAEEDQGKHQDSGRDEENTVYSNVTVSSESHVQPHGLLYSTVRFNTDTDRGDAKPHAAAVTYSAIRRTSTGEATVYCNV